MPCSSDISANKALRISDRSGFLLRYTIFSVTRCTFKDLHFIHSTSFKGSHLQGANVISTTPSLPVQQAARIRYQLYAPSGFVRAHLNPTSLYMSSPFRLIAMLPLFNPGPLPTAPRQFGQCLSYC